MRASGSKKTNKDMVVVRNEWEDIVHSLEMLISYGLHYFHDTGAVVQKYTASPALNKQQIFSLERCLGPPFLHLPLN